MADLHDQTLATTVEDTQRFAFGRPGQAGAFNIRWVDFLAFINANITTPAVPPQTGVTFVGGNIDLSKVQGTYYDAITQSEDITFNFVNEVNGGLALIRITANGTNTFTFTAIESSGVVSGESLPAGSYFFRFLETPNGVSVVVFRDYTEKATDADADGGSNDTRYITALKAVRLLTNNYRIERSGDDWNFNDTSGSPAIILRSDGSMEFPGIPIATIAFEAGSGQNFIALSQNSADALSIISGVLKYFQFDTVVGAEKIRAFQDFQVEQFVTYSQQGAEPAAPAAGFIRVYAFGGDLKTVNSSGDRSTISSTLLKTTVTVTSAQILALATTPVPILQAPGANRAIIVHRDVYSIDFNTTPYATNQSVHLSMSGSPVTVDSSILGATTDTVSSQVASIDNFMINAGLDLQAFNPGPNPTAGDSDLKVTVYYTIEEI